MDQYLEQYWRPYPQRPDSLALYFRVNMGRAMASGRFAPEVQGPVAVRGDAKYSAGKLDWNVSKLTLEREAGSVYDGSFWSGVCYLPADQVRTGDTLRYRYYIEGNGVHGWEDLTFDRQFIYTESLLNGSRDTTLHWVFFQDTSATNVPALGRDAQPRSFRLSQNYPNPFNSNTRLVYSLHTETSVLLEIFDSKGAFTATLVRRRLRPGMYSTMWSGASEEGDAVPSGIYFARLTTEFGVAIRKILLLR